MLKVKMKDRVDQRKLRTRLRVADRVFISQWDVGETSSGVIDNSEELFLVVRVFWGGQDQDHQKKKKKRSRERETKGAYQGL